MTLPCISAPIFTIKAASHLRTYLITGSIISLVHDDFSARRLLLPGIFMPFSIMVCTKRNMFPIYIIKERQ